MTGVNVTAGTPVRCGAALPLALKNGEAGKRYHAVAEEGVRFRDIATAPSKGLDLPLTSIAPDNAAEHFRWVANFAAVDVWVPSARTQPAVGWTPTGPGLIAGLETGHYFGHCVSTHRPV